MVRKQFSPAATSALTEALARVFWYKQDLRRFLEQAVRDPQVVSRLSWDNYKLRIVDELIAYLVVHQRREQYFSALETLCAEVCKMDDAFPNLAKLDDGARKVNEARKAQGALRKVWASHTRTVDEGQAGEARRKAQIARVMDSDGVQARVAALHALYCSFVTSEATQRRGYELEKILYELFRIFDLDPKASFKVEGEQIDGGFSLEGTDYILEAKWRGELTPLSDLQAFSARIQTRLRNAIGVFLTINGYEEAAKTRAWSGEKNFLMMEGPDLVAVLEGRIDLTTLLVRKRRHGSMKASPYLSVNEVL